MSSGEPVPDPRPATFDVDHYLVDPVGELDRCADAYWYADGLDLTGGPMPWVLAHDQVRAVLRDRRLCPRSFTTDMVAAGIPEQVAEQLTPLFRRTGEEHRQHRSLLASAFTPRRIEVLRPTTAAVADRLAGEIERSARRGEPCEFVPAFAAPLPAEVFAVLFGLPVDDRDLLAAWGTVVAQAFMPFLEPDQVAGVERAAGELRAYSERQIELRRHTPTDDLITHLLEAEIDGEGLDDGAIVDTVSAFIFAGSETTKRQLTQLVVAFAEHPDDWERVHDDPDLLPGSIEEVLRLHSIIPGLTRLADEPFEHDGLRREPGERLMVSMTTANRDAGRFEVPDEFDITRANAAEHLTFGWGPHFCLGAPLARMELQESLRALTQRFRAPRVLAAGAASAFTAPDELTVELTPR